MNGVKTALLMGMLMGLCLGVGQLLGGRHGLVIGLAVGGGGVLISYFFSAQMAIAMVGGKQVTAQEDPELIDVVGKLAQRAGLPMPKVYVSPEPAPNAFATGRGPRSGVVCVTQGLLGMMNRSELEGVIAHELAHIKHRDILISTIAAVMAGAIAFLARMAMWFGTGSRDDRDRGAGGLIAAVLLMIFAPLAAMLIQMAISRSREYSADATGSDIAGGPTGLISALKKLEVGNSRIPMEVSPSASHMFISAPWIPSAEGIGNMYRTHPSTERRIAKLVEKLGVGNAYAV